MLRTLSKLFPPFKTSERVQSSRPRHSAVGLHVERLGERVLLTTGLGLSSGWNLPPFLNPQPVPNLVGKIVAIPNHIGYVEITSQNGSSFQGLFEGTNNYSITVPGTHENYKVFQDPTTVDIRGPVTIPISGTLGFGYLIVSGPNYGAMTYSISFSGQGTRDVLEKHTYTNDNGNSDGEEWDVSDFETVNFTGSVVVGSNSQLNGTMDVQDTAQWVWANDTLPSRDPNHSTYMDEFGPTVITLSGPMMLTLDKHTTTPLSNVFFM
jgi:hypothetical protein